jgi:acetoin utilization deacetylase AcuC-like enzyme
MPQRSLAVLESPLFREHRASGLHPECPERLQAAEEGLRVALQRSDVARLAIAARAATNSELLRVHHPDYILRLQNIRGRSGELDADTFFSPGSLAAAEAAAGGVMDLTTVLRRGQATAGVALVRPPGHHATASRAMGFCLLNNVALAAAHALADGARRVMIVDWDVHHGNGTQDIFWREPRVLYFSTHQHPLYPGSGHREEVGEAEGRGFTVNVPLSHGADDAALLEVWRRLLLPIVRQFAPQLLLVSAGYDAHERDPLASLRVSSAGFGELAAQLARATLGGAHCPMALVLEGGYDLSALREAVGASVEGMLRGLDPSASLSPPSLEKSKHSAEIDAACRIQRQFWAV